MLIAPHGQASGVNNPLVVPRCSPHGTQPQTRATAGKHVIDRAGTEMAIAALGTRARRLQGARKHVLPQWWGWVIALFTMNISAFAMGNVHQNLGFARSSCGHSHTT